MNRHEKIEKLIEWLIDKSLREEVEWVNARGKILECETSFGKFELSSNPAYTSPTPYLKWNGDVVPYDLFPEEIQDLKKMARAMNQLYKLDEHTEKFQLEFEVLFQDESE